MIQPGIWTDEGFLSLSIPARLMFIGMISGADDEGRGLATDRCLKASVFPSDDVTLEQVRTYRDEVAAAVNVKLYDVDGKKYYQCSKWRNHQRLERPTKSHIPPAPDDARNDAGTIPDTSGTTPAELKKELKKEEKETVAEAVTLTPSEREKLESQYGAASTAAAISKLSAYKLAKGKRYKSDYGAILQWAMRAVMEKGSTVPKPDTMAWACGYCGAKYRSTAATCAKCGWQRP